MSAIWRLARGVALALAFGGCISPDLIQKLPAEVGDAEVIGTMERMDPKFDDLISLDAKIEVLSDAFSWAEGPVWDKRGGFLLFSDIPRNTVWKWSEKGGLEKYLEPSGYTSSAAFTGSTPGSNGLAIDAIGQLVLCQHGDRRVARYDGNQFITIADNYEGKRLNSPNDLVLKSNGDLYFTDPPYGLGGLMNDQNKELDFQGVFRVSSKGELTLLTKAMSRPNGIAFSPDEKILYVSNSDPAKPIYMAFPVLDDGTLGEGKTFFDATDLVNAKKLGLNDGIKIDKDGNVFAAGPGGVLVFDKEGKHLGTINPGLHVANCAWGDDGSALYIMAGKYLLRVKTLTKGFGF